MPSGSNPNSRKNLVSENAKKNRFNGENGAKNQAKGNEVRKYMSSARKALKSALTDEELNKQIDALLKRGRQGNLTAIKMVFEYSDITDNENSAVTQNVIELPAVLPDNVPPKEEENNE